MLQEDFSFAPSLDQQRLWLLTYLSPHSAAYNMSLCLRLEGKLQLDILETSLNEVISRHEALRTNFRIENEQLLQVIYRENPINIKLVDFSYFHFEEQEKLTQQLFEEESLKCFNLAEEPLLKATLIKLKPEVYDFILVIHHIIADGQSIMILLSECFEIYKSKILNKTTNLKPLDIQYVDFVNWQQQCFESPVLKKQLDYWQNKLKGDLPILNLPVSKPLPLRPNYQGKTRSFFVNKELTNLLKLFAQNNSSTLFHVLLTSFYTLLYVYSKQKEIILGVPFSGRPRTELQNSIGCFAYPLPLRLDINTEETFSALLKNVRNLVYETQQNQDISFSKIAEIIKPTRQKHYNPIFQVLFNLIKAFPSREDFGLKVNMTRFKGTKDFDLILNVLEHADECVMSLWYSTNIFDDNTVESLVGFYLEILQKVVTEPVFFISQLNLPEILLEKREIATQFVNNIYQQNNISSNKNLFVANETESKILAIWKEVLGIENIGLEDNFFDLGGHSRLMVQVHLKLQKVYEIELLELFNRPTIRSLAQYLNQQSNQKDVFAQTQLRAQSRRDLLDKQRRLRQQAVRFK